MYLTGQAPGAITINTAQRKLYLSLGGGRAIEMGSVLAGKALHGKARRRSVERRFGPAGRPLRKYCTPPGST